jgi:N-acetylglucosamine kinase-like BadF-type ATPase
MTGGLLVGIDAGGTSTRARAVRGGTVVHTGRGGPGNPCAVDAEVLGMSYEHALRGCPPPERIVAAVAGAGSAVMRDRVGSVLSALYPRSDVTVTADYVAAYLALPPDTQVCVIAGTGSAVCSRRADGEWLVSGGRGWILGDHGSAARLGQALLGWYVEDPDTAPPEVAGLVLHALGTADWHQLVAQVHSASAPAAQLAAVAPVLTGLAERGHQRACGLLVEQMSALARTTVDHALRLREQEPSPAGGPVRAGLVGGVWRSNAAVEAFTRALAAHGNVVTLPRGATAVDPIDGALCLAGAPTTTHPSTRLWG